MAHKYLVAYYYVSPRDAEPIDAFRDLSGDSEKTLITQYVRGWIGRNREYYLNLAKFDAEKRDTLFRQWAEIVVMEGIEALPPYKHEVRDIPPNRLKESYYYASSSI